MMDGTNKSDQTAATVERIMEAETLDLAEQKHGNLNAAIVSRVLTNKVPEEQSENMNNN